MSVQALKTEDVRSDGGTQMRAGGIDNAVVAEYRDALGRGVELPPIVVFHDGKKYWLADGFHRINAIRDVGRKTVDADVRKGTVREAVLFAVGANSNHGFHRTRADKRRAVTTLLEDKEWSGWSDRVIAEKCHVSHTLVAAIRKELLPTGNVASSRSSTGNSPSSKSRRPAKTKGKDGKTRRRPKPKARSTPKPDDFPVEEEKSSSPAALTKEANEAAKVVSKTVASFLRLNPRPEDMGPVMDALDNSMSNVEGAMVG